MTYTKIDLNWIALALYGLRRALPSAGAAYQARITTHAKGLVLVELAAAVERERAWVESSKDRIAEVQAALQRAQDRRSVYHIDSERARLAWHVKAMARHEAQARRLARLYAKVLAHGLPAPEAFAVLGPPLADVLA
jgi:hypothetical protein